MTDNRILVLGTRNEGKRRELELLLARLGLQLLTLREFPDAVDVEETGETFAENARLKATQQARQLNQWVLGEDSGLCVEALDGAPGVYSARFAGVPSDDRANNELLLERLKDLPPARRGAQYHCHVALSDPKGDIRLKTHGECRGRIVTEPRGSNGFGYDPLFEIVEFHQTFGELGDAVKSVLSHRARAMRRFAQALAKAQLI